MKLNHIITEAFDKNLALKVANQLGITTDRLKEIIVRVDDQNMTNGVWVLKQIKKYSDIGVRIQKRLKKALDKFKLVQDRLADKNINNYDLESLETAVSAFSVEQEDVNIHPISGNGVELIEHVKSGSDDYWIYAFYEANILAKWSRGGEKEVKDDGSQPSWCTRHENNARTYLSTSPQVMIFRNDKPTTLFALDRSQIKNSGNTDESRPEMRKLVNHVIDTYSDRIKAESVKFKPPFERILAKCEMEPANCTPDKLNDEERDALLDDIVKTVMKYVPAVVKATGREFPRWAFFENILMNAVSTAPMDGGNYFSPSALVVRYYEHNEQGFKPLEQYFDSRYRYDPTEAIKGIVTLLQKLREQAFSEKNVVFVNMYKKMVQDYFIDNPDIANGTALEQSDSEEIPAILEAIRAVANYGARNIPNQEFDRWLLSSPIPDKIKQNPNWLEHWNDAKTAVRHNYEMIITAKFYIISPGTLQQLYKYDFKYKSQFEEYTISATIDDSLMYRHAQMITPDGDMVNLSTSDVVLEDFNHDREMIPDEMVSAGWDDSQVKKLQDGTLFYQATVSKKENRLGPGNYTTYKIISID